VFGVNTFFMTKAIENVYFVVLAREARDASIEGSDVAALVRPSRSATQETDHEDSTKSTLTGRTGQRRIYECA
jgi:hypothetical protein